MSVKDDDILECRLVDGWVCPYCDCDEPEEYPKGFGGEYVCANCGKRWGGFVNNRTDDFYD
jgi:Transcription initiation factor TFIIIB, Brf1 subunit/Transcription initiation factor TFIIB